PVSSSGSSLRRAPPSFVRSSRTCQAIAIACSSPATISAARPRTRSVRRWGCRASTSTACCFALVKDIASCTPGEWGKQKASETPTSCGAPHQKPRFEVRMNHDYVDEHGIAARYVSRTLSADQEREFEAHLVDCPRCVDEVQFGEALRTGLREPVFETTKGGISAPS